MKGSCRLTLMFNVSGNSKGKTCQFIPTLQESGAFTTHGGYLMHQKSLWEESFSKDNSSAVILWRLVLWKQNTTRMISPDWCYTVNWADKALELVSVATNYNKQSTCLSAALVEDNFILCLRCRGVIQQRSRTARNILWTWKIMKHPVLLIVRPISLVVRKLVHGGHRSLVTSMFLKAITVLSHGHLEFVFLVRNEIW